MALTIGSGTFTLGSNTVTSVVFSSGGPSFIASGTVITVGSEPLIFQGEATEATTSTIKLRDDWDLPSGTHHFVATYTTENLRDAVQSAKGFASQLEQANALISTLGKIYSDTAEGLANTASGDFFSVAGTGDVFITLYENDNGVAVEFEQVASKERVDLAVVKGAEAAASFGKISNTNQDDLQSTLLAIADIPTNSELATALSPIATSAELTPLAQSSELAPLATSSNVSDSESNVISAINSKTGPLLQAKSVVQLSSELNTGQSFSIVPPDSDSFIRLTLLTTHNQVISSTNVYAGARKILDTVTFRTSIGDQNEGSATAIPARFIISEHLGANFSISNNVSSQFNGAVLSPISGGRGETIEIETGATARYFYAYEVWK